MFIAGFVIGIIVANCLELAMYRRIPKRKRVRPVGQISPLAKWKKIES